MNTATEKSSKLTYAPADSGVLAAGASIYAQRIGVSFTGKYDAGSRCAGGQFSFEWGWDAASSLWAQNYFQMTVSAGRGPAGARRWLHVGSKPLILG